MAINDGRVVSNYIMQAISNNDLTVYGTGEQTRSFCYVTDLIDGLKKLFFTPDIFTPVNLGNPTPISMLELAKEIIELTDSASKIKFLPLPSDDPKIREPNITKAMDLLKWKPTINRREGISQTINYFQRVYEN
jgi:UDP-glucuronate decarboxylase